MTYRPRTPRGEFFRQAILAALREHGPLNTTMLARAIGYISISQEANPAYPMRCEACDRRHGGPVKRQVTSADLQPTQTTMLRHGELSRYRAHTSDLWVWSLGPHAPAPVDVAALEEALR